jgi:Plavaka transposase
MAMIWQTIIVMILLTRIVLIRRRDNTRYSILLSMVRTNTLIQSNTDYSIGRPCDKNGNYLPPGTPPPPFDAPPPTDWSPFKSRIHFETSEFIYTRNQMSATDIDTLLGLWADSLLEYDGVPLFNSHRELYKTIDEAKAGDVPWSSFKVKYEGPLPVEEPPSWMLTEYDVWYRDPHEVVKNMLANTDFDGEMDPAPFRHYNINGDREYQNFMSADWAWNQAVRALIYHNYRDTHSSNRTSFRRILPLTDPCSSL